MVSALSGLSMNSRLAASAAPSLVKRLRRFLVEQRAPVGREILDDELGALHRIQER
jgi:hypothetical protein